jgi:hypothetical protein
MANVKFFVNGGANGAGIIGGRRFSEPTVIELDEAEDAALVKALRGAGPVVVEDPELVKKAEKRLRGDSVIHKAIKKFQEDVKSGVLVDSPPVEDEPELPDDLNDSKLDLAIAQFAKEQGVETPIADLSRDKLRALCKNNGLQTGGNKAELRDRLAEAGITG